MTDTKINLTAKQEDFCVAYIACGNASEAYRRAYNTENMTPFSVNRSAKASMDNAKIAARLLIMRAPAVKEAQVTLTNHLDDLKSLRDAANKKGQFGPAIQAEVARGKAAGLYVERHRLEGKDGDALTITVTPPTLAAK